MVTTAVVWSLGLDAVGVSIVGVVPQGLPPLTLPSFSTDLIGLLLLPALLISVIGFVESVSVAQTLAAKKRQRIDPDQELIGLGAANIGAAFTGGYPVTGGFARSVVNFDAGAETPAAGAFTAVGLAIAAIALTPLIYFLPTATLAATIIVAVLSLVDFSILKRSWTYSKADFVAVARDHRADPRAGRGNRRFGRGWCCPSLCTSTNHLAPISPKWVLFRAHSISATSTVTAFSPIRRFQTPIVKKRRMTPCTAGAIHRRHGLGRHNDRVWPKSCRCRICVGPEANIH